MSGAEDRSFLARWSQRKTAARLGEPLSEPAPPVAPPGPEPSAAAGPGAACGETPELQGELPPVESLQGLLSDYRDFMRPDVDARLRRAALRRLFSDPHFNRMDRLDVYIDDYSIPDPIPEAMMKNLEHAKVLFRPLEEERTAAAQRARRADTDSGGKPEDEVRLERQASASQCPDASRLSGFERTATEGERTERDSG